MMLVRGELTKRIVSDFRWFEVTSEEAFLVVKNWVHKPLYLWHRHHTIVVLAEKSKVGFGLVHSKFHWYKTKGTDVMASLASLGYLVEFEVRVLLDTLGAVSHSEVLWQR